MTHSVEGEKLTEEEVDELVDVLRRNLLYQTPTMIMGQNGEIDYLTLRFREDHFIRVVDIIEKAGGWDLSDEQREELMENNVRNLAKALTHGQVDMTKLDAGSLMHLAEQADQVEGGSKVAESCRAELQRRSQGLN